MRDRTLWAVLWQSENRLDGKRAHIMNGGDCLPVLFRSRRAARQYAAEHYGYIATRPDLRREPHGWKMPQAIKVRLVLAQEARRDA